MKFIDNETKTEIDLDNENSKNALSNPRYTPVDKIKSYAVKAEDGIYDFTDLNKAREFAQKTKSEILTHHDDLVQGFKDSTLATVGAGVAGVARGVTFGLSDLAARGIQEATGLPLAENLNALEEASPIVSGVGEAAGMIVPAFFTGGASTPLSASAKAASFGVKAAEKIATRAGESIAEKIGSKVAGKVAESAVRGAEYGVGTGISDISLADTPILSAKSAGDLATSALFGAAFDVGTLGVGTAIKKAWKGSKGVAELGTKIAKDSIPGMEGVDNKLVDVISKGDKEVKDILMMGTKGREKLKNSSVLPAIENINTVKKEIDKVTKDYYAQSLEELKNTADYNLLDATPFKSKLDELIATPKTNPTIKGEVQRIRDIFEVETAKITDRANEIAKTANIPSADADKLTKELVGMQVDILEDLKQRLSTRIRMYEKNPLTGVTRDELIGLKSLQNDLKSTFERAGTGTKYQEMQENYRKSKNLQDFINFYKKDGSINSAKFNRNLKPTMLNEGTAAQWETDLKNAMGSLPPNLLSDAHSTAISSSIEGLKKNIKNKDLLKKLEATNSMNGVGNLKAMGLGYFLGGPVGLGVAAMNPGNWIGSVDAVSGTLRSSAYKAIEEKTKQAFQNFISKPIGAYKKGHYGVNAAFDVFATKLANDWRNPSNYETFIDKMSNYNPELNFKNSDSYTEDVMMKAAEINQYLGSKAPQIKEGEFKKIAPTPTELNKFALQVTAATQPLKVLQDAMENSARINPIQMQVLQELYPDLVVNTLGTDITQFVPRTGGLKTYQEIYKKDEIERKNSKKSDGVKLTEPSNIQRATTR